MQSINLESRDVNFVRRTALVVVLALVVGFLATWVPMSANAASTSGSVSSFYSGGKLYSDQNTLSTNTPGQIQGSTGVWTGSPCPPTGWLGVNPRLLYSSNNALAQSNGFGYGGSCSNWSTVIRTVRGTYYNYGIAAAYNGSSYTTAYALPTPSLSF